MLVCRKEDLPPYNNNNNNTHSDGLMENDDLIKTYGRTFLWKRLTIQLMKKAQMIVRKNVIIKCLIFSIMKSF